MSSAVVWFAEPGVTLSQLRALLGALSQPPFELRFNKIGDDRRGYYVSLPDDERLERLHAGCERAALSLGDSRRKPIFELGYGPRGLSRWCSVGLSQAQTTWPAGLCVGGLRLLALTLSPLHGYGYIGTPGKGPYGNLHTRPGAYPSRWLPPPGHGIPNTYIRAEEVDDPRSPEFYEWLNYWSPATAAHLGFPDASRDAEWLSRAEHLENGGWILQLTPEPLDMEGRPDHVATVRRFLERFPQVGFRDRPGVAPSGAG